MRIGAVNYLNSKPLIERLPHLAPGAMIRCDLPSRLADSLQAARLDVALVPSIECFRTPVYRVVSDACVACSGPVLSVKLHFRVPPCEVRRLALDEGSRTSAALGQIMLREFAGIVPKCEPLPIGHGLQDTDADAVLLIGDRAMQWQDADSYEVWDLGEQWNEWTGLPFVFAMWIARAGMAVDEIAGLLAAARDQGVASIDDIAVREARGLQLPVDLAARYLRENLNFTLRDRELRGLRHFGQLCHKHGLAEAPTNRSIEELYTHGCVTH